MKIAANELNKFAPNRAYVAFVVAKMADHWKGLTVYKG
jgi:hypothetical protein